MCISVWLTKLPITFVMGVWNGCSSTYGVHVVDVMSSKTKNNFLQLSFCKWVQSKQKINNSIKYVSFYTNCRLSLSQNIPSLRQNHFTFGTDVHSELFLFLFFPKC